MLIFALCKYFRHRPFELEAIGLIIFDELHFAIFYRVLKAFSAFFFSIFVFHFDYPFSLYVAFLSLFLLFVHKVFCFICIRLLSFLYAFHVYLFGITCFHCFETFSFDCIVRFCISNVWVNIFWVIYSNLIDCVLCCCYALSVVSFHCAFMCFPFLIIFESLQFKKCSSSFIYYSFYVFSFFFSDTYF